MFFAMARPVSVFVPSIIENITCPVEIKRFFQKPVKKGEVVDCRDEFEGAVDEKFGLPESRGPKKHGGETLLFKEIGITQAADPAHAEAVQGLRGIPHGFRRRQGFMVLADQGDVLPDVEVRNQRVVQGDDPPVGMTGQEVIPIPFEDVLLVEENQMTDRAINEITSMNMMARKTRIMP